MDYFIYLCTMRVLIVNTSEKTGGAAVAANRLMEALKNNGVKAKMLVREKETEQITVVGLPGHWHLQWHFLWERLTIYLYNHFRKDHLFEIDIANSGTDITSLPEFKEADVIHLNWINQGMLSLKDIRKIIKSGKAVVWTMHDIWPATGICHYTRGCVAYRNRCNHCQLLPNNGSDNDLSTKVFLQKKKMLDGKNVYFVTCSRWLENEAKKSNLLIGQQIHSIPNAIDTHVFQPIDKKIARQMAALPQDKRIVLFVSQRVTDKRKGMEYFMDAIRQLTEKDPVWRDHTAVAILGGHADELSQQLDLPVYPLGYVSDERRIVAIYNSADVFVLPSLEDNLPNTIMEAMACGIPCVGFRVGGIPEMIDHQQTGYVAVAGDAADLANGIRWVLDSPSYDALSHACVHKVATKYSQQSVAMRYIEVYNEALAFKHYKI